MLSAEFDGAGGVTFSGVIPSQTFGPGAGRYFEATDELLGDQTNTLQLLPAGPPSAATAPRPRAWTGAMPMGEADEIETSSGRAGRRE
jgi:hypothetical protein